jgi:homoserine kinase type II
MVHETRPASDDAGGGRRGLRAQLSRDLLDALERNYAIVPHAAPRDLGGSSNLNLLVNDGRRKLVARVYRPSVSVARLTDIQNARRQLAAAGFPCLPPIPAANRNAWASVGPSLMEVEEYVESDGCMNTPARVEAGLRVLGRMHNALRKTQTSTASEAPPFVNYIAPRDVVEASHRGAARIRSWGPTADEARLADAAEELAYAVSDVHETFDSASITRQLVHGDFWDNNVLYRGRDIVLIHDFDHMGKRARIEDAALTIYFINSEPTVERDENVHWLRRLVDAYDSGLENPLNAEERAALPVAIARQPLWSVGGWIADLDDDGAARQHARGMLENFEFALEIMRSLPRWQEALA